MNTEAWLRMLARAIMGGTLILLGGLQIVIAVGLGMHPVWWILGVAILTLGIMIWVRKR